MKNIVVAYDKERAIGKDGGLLWNPGEMRDDMKHFKTLTKGAIVIMGRKTLDSIGMALPDRRNIVLSRSDTSVIPNIEIVHSLEEAYSLNDDNQEQFIIGGGEIFKEALKDVDRIYATEVDASIAGADTFFPALNNDSWQETDEKTFPSDENNIYPYRFVTYERK